MPVYFETSRLHNEGVEAALATLVKYGGEVLTMSDAEVARMRAKVEAEVWPGIAAKSADCARGVEIYKEYFKDKGRL